LKVTFPHMGNMWVSVKTLLEELGLDVVVPPPSTKRTLSLGTRYSPEFICLPLKISLGNFIEAAERGADTFIMAGGVGPCRFGYYGRLQKEILDDIGYPLDLIVIEPPERHFVEVMNSLRKLKKCSLSKAVGAVRLGWLKCCVIDIVEEKLHQIRGCEEKTGSADLVFSRFIIEMDLARTRKDIISLKEQALEEMDSLPRSISRKVIRIGVVGEIYSILEPFMNLDLERNLGRLGVETVRTLFLSRWVNDHVLGGILPMEGTEEDCRMAAPYLNYFVGGHGRESVGSTVKFAREGFDGVIQIAPLTCGPEIVAEAILPKVSMEEGIPVMTIYLDEQSGEAGFITRLEAFVDMIRRSIENRGKNQPCPSFFKEGDVVCSRPH